VFDLNLSGGVAVCERCCWASATDRDDPRRSVPGEVENGGGISLGVPDTEFCLSLSAALRSANDRLSGPETSDRLRDAADGRLSKGYESCCEMEPLEIGAEGGCIIRASFGCEVCPGIGALPLAIGKDAFRD